MGEGFQRLNTRIQKFAGNATGALGVAGLAGALFLVKRAIGSVVTTGAELEQQLVGAAVRFGPDIKKGTAAFKELEDEARRVGKTTEFTSIQTASALRGLALAGFEAGESMKLLAPLSDLATAGEVDLAEATDIATGSLGAFGLRTADAAQQVKNLKRIGDAMAKTANSTRTTMTGLFETMRLGAPLAKEAGISLESFLTVAGQLGQAGIDNTRAGTAIMNMFTELSTPRTEKGLKKLGVRMENLGDGTLNVAKLINQLRDGLADLEPRQRLNRLTDLFGKRGGKAVAVLISSEVGSFETLKGKLDNAEGSVAAMAFRLRQTRAVDIKLFNSAVEGLAVTFSKATDDGIGGFIKGMTTMVRGFDSFVERFPIVAKFLGLILAAAGAFIVVGLIIAAVGAAISFVIGSTIALFVAVAVAVGTVAIGLGLWLSKLEPVQKFFDFLFGTISDIATLWNDLTTIDFDTGIGKVILDLFTGAGDEPSGQGPADRAVDRSESESRATLLVRDQRESPALVLESDDTPSAISLVVDESGAF